MKAVLIRISTQEVIKKAKYPRADMGEVIGLDSDLKWLLEYIPKAPVCDPLTHRLEVTNEITETNHPDHPIDRYERFYKKIQLTQEEISLRDKLDKENTIMELELQGVDVDYNEHTFHFSREMASQFLGVAQLSEKLQQPTMEWKNNKIEFIEIPLNDAYMIAAEALTKFKQIHNDNV